MTDPETIEFYDRQTEAYKKLASGFENRELHRLTSALPKGAHVLDLGCGPGQDSAALVKSGFRVTAMDASPEMLRQLGLVDGITTRLASFDQLDDVAEFDAVWASFSLLHAPKAQFPSHLAAIWQALKPGGILVLALKTGAGEHRDALGRFYAYYDEDELRRLLEMAGFEIGEVSHGASRGMAGTLDPFITISAHA